MFTIFIVSATAVLCWAQSHVTASKCSSSFGCMSSLTPEYCRNLGEYLQPNLLMGGCCPGCAVGAEKCASCQNSDCASGLSCSDTFKCILDDKSCFHTSHMKPAVTYKPKCTATGQYAAKQCIGDITLGRCFCYSEEGQRIFGWSWWKNADDMTCACSRERNRLKKSRRLQATLHCQQNGNYEELQCDSGVCWCADPKTGGIQDQTIAVPESLWRNLPCYNPKLHGESYLRQCESISFAQNAMALKFYNRGTLQVYFPHIMCDYDGTYGTYSLEGGAAHCTWRDGTKIGGFQTPLENINSMNCFCARDQKIFEANSITLTGACTGNGNYQDIQYENGQFYCIDRNGFNVSDLFDNKEDLKCEQYLYYQKFEEQC